MGKLFVMVFAFLPAARQVLLLPRQILLKHALGYPPSLCFVGQSQPSLKLRLAMRASASNLILYLDPPAGGLAPIKLVPPIFGAGHGIPSFGLRSLGEGVPCTPAARRRLANRAGRGVTVFWPRWCGVSGLYPVLTSGNTTCPDKIGNLPILADRYGQAIDNMTVKCIVLNDYTP